MAKIDGQAAIAKQFITNQKQRQHQDSSRDLSAFARVNALEREMDIFRQAPNKTNFSNLQKSCLTLQGALSEIAQLRSKLTGISCESGSGTNKLANSIFDLREGLAAVVTACGGKQMASQKTIDQQLSHGQKCLSLSRLSNKDTSDYRDILHRVDLNRDDKAHNFVVTLNALEDGNWLALLALGLAIAIDSLVFISGLIGAKTAAYEFTGNPSEIIRYGLGATAEIYGTEPEDILTRKIFLRYVSRINDEHKPVIDIAKVAPDDLLYINKVLTIAGQQAKQIDPSQYRNPLSRQAINRSTFDNPATSQSAIFSLDEGFYQNLVRQVYLWDEFNRPSNASKTAAQRKSNTYSQNHIYPQNNIAKDKPFSPPFGEMAKGAITRKGSEIPFTTSGPEREPGSVPAVTNTQPVEIAISKSNMSTRDFIKTPILYVRRKGQRAMLCVLGTFWP